MHELPSNFVPLWQESNTLSKEQKEAHKDCAKRINERFATLTKATGGPTKRSFRVSQRTSIFGLCFSTMRLSIVVRPNAQESIGPPSFLRLATTETPSTVIRNKN